MGEDKVVVSADAPDDDCERREKMTPDRIFWRMLQGDVLHDDLEYYAEHGSNGGKYRYSYRLKKVGNIVTDIVEERSSYEDDYWKVSDWTVTEVIEYARRTWFEECYHYTDWRWCFN